MKLTFLILLAFSFARAEKMSLEARATRLGCKAALSTTASTEMLCFQNNVIDPGQPTETKGCSVRRFNIETNQFIGFPNHAQKNQLVLAPQLCEKGGLDAILDWPVNERAFVEDELISLFDTSNDLQTWGTQKAPRLFALTQTLKKTIEMNKRSKGATRSAPPAAAAASAMVPPANTLTKHASVQVFFAADRQYVPNKPPAETFNDDRNTNSKLTLGSVSVSIPANHKFGNLEMPDVFTLKMTLDPDRYVVLKSVEKLEPGRFWKQLQNRVQKANKKELFVFVHGFNVSFEEAAQRTAQMAYDLKFPGAPVFYSWPSETILRYSVAEKNVEWTLSHLTEFLKELTEKSGATEIHLIAHSMGNRALTNALNNLAQTRFTNASPLFKNVILAAPDVDQRAFLKIATSVRSTTTALTLYASRNDRALQISARVHHAPRLGQTGDDTLISPFLDTIDASSVDVSFLGHSYYGDNPSVVSDMAEVVIDSLSVFQRPFLKAMQTRSGNTYWKLLPN